jgi:site-specific DNA-methyltransferase (adenine-specific)
MSDGKKEILLGDCLELMKDIPSGSIDMILADLPYGRTQNKWDSIIPFDKLWEHYNRIIKDNGCIALFADGLFMADLMMSNRKMWRYNLVWNKVLTSGFLNANRMPLRQHEEVCIFYKKQPTYNPQKIKGKPNHSKGKPKICDSNNYGAYDFVDNGKEHGDMKHPTSILTFSKPHPSVMLHPTEKSIECCKWLIKTYTNECDLVLDNCMGSGTTAVACINTNRNFIGFELDPTYYAIAEERIKKAKAQGKEIIYEQTH